MCNGICNQGRSCDCNEPYSTIQRIADVIFNFLTAIGAVAFAGIVGYFWARFL
jgi:hypothetical protein